MLPAQPGQRFHARRYLQNILFCYHIAIASSFSRVYYSMYIILSGKVQAFNDNSVTYC